MGHEQRSAKTFDSYLHLSRIVAGTPGKQSSSKPPLAQHLLAFNSGSLAKLLVGLTFAVLAGPNFVGIEVWCCYMFLVWPGQQPFVRSVFQNGGQNDKQTS